MTRAVQIVPFESSYLPGNKSIRKIWTDGTKMRILVRYIATLQKSHNPTPIIDSLTPLDAQASLAPNLGFPYFNCLGEAQCKKTPCIFHEKCDLFLCSVLEVPWLS